MASGLTKEYFSIKKNQAEKQNSIKNNAGEFTHQAASDST